jgi:hypothetical protein
MRKLPQSTILSGLLALMVSAPLPAQTARNPQTAPNPSTESTTPAGQAPEEVMKKLSDLVHAGKYAEAQHLTSGLLAAYPNDKRLIKAELLLKKSLANTSANATPGSNQPTGNVTSAQPALNTSVEQLAGMDRVDYNALVELARQAQQTTDLAEQKKLLHQFMDESNTFLRKHPMQMLLWQLRAATAITLNEPIAGFEAGEKLLAIGAADSNDPNLQRLLAQLKNKGWLDKQAAEQAQEQKDKPRDISVALTGDASDGGLFRQKGNGIVVINLRSRIENDLIARLQSRFPHTNVLINTPDAGDPVLRLTINLQDSDVDSKCGWLSCDVYANSKLRLSVYSPAGQLAERTFTLQIKRSVSKGGSAWDMEKAAPVLQEWMGQEVLEKFQSVLDEDAVRTSMRQSPTP